MLCVQITYPIDWQKHYSSVEELVRWLKKLLRYSQRDRRVKLMVTGWQEKGKTTLVRRLQRDFEYDENIATKGKEVVGERQRSVISKRHVRQRLHINFPAW